MLAVIRSNKNRGILSIHLSQHYTPIHGMVFDDEVAIEQDASGDVVVIKRENDLEAFRQIDERFINEWDHKSSAFQWNTYFEETPHIFSKKEVETFLSKKKRPRKKQEI
jgi:chlorite dismutase